MPSQVASAILSSAFEAGMKSLLESEADRVVRQYGIKVAASALARDKTELEPIARRLGFPVVLKIVSKDVQHKSDVGGVRTGIASLRQAREAYESILANVKRASPKADVAGILVQKMAPAGTEFVIGGTRDRQFGPAVMFGLGGIYVELFRDVSFRLAPLSEDEAFGMIMETKASRLLTGFRGSGPLDEEAAARTIVALGALMVEHPEIDSVDINPLFVYPKGVLAVDVRILLKTK